MFFFPTISTVFSQQNKTKPANNTKIEIFNQKLLLVSISKHRKLLQQKRMTQFSVLIYFFLYLSYNLSEQRRKKHSKKKQPQEKKTFFRVIFAQLSNLHSQLVEQFFTLTKLGLVFFFWKILCNEQKINRQTKNTQFKEVDSNNN